MYDYELGYDAVSSLRHPLVRGRDPFWSLLCKTVPAVPLSSRPPLNVKVLTRLRWRTARVADGQDFFATRSIRYLFRNEGVRLHPWEYQRFSWHEK